MTAIVYNVNRGHNPELMKACKSLSCYAEFIGRIRENCKYMKIADAVEAAITSCIEDDILAEFLTKNRAEVSMSVITEYKEELHLKNVRKEGYDTGLSKLQRLIKILKEKNEDINIALDASPEELEKLFEDYSIK